MKAKQTKGPKANEDKGADELLEADRALAADLRDNPPDDEVEDELLADDDSRPLRGWRAFCERWALTRDADISNLMRAGVSREEAEKAHTSAREAARRMFQRLYHRIDPDRSDLSLGDREKILLIEALAPDTDAEELQSLASALARIAKALADNPDLDRKASKDRDIFFGKMIEVATAQKSGPLAVADLDKVKFALPWAWCSDLGDGIVPLCLLTEDAFSKVMEAGGIQSLSGKAWAKVFEHMGLHRPKAPRYGFDGFVKYGQMLGKWIERHGGGISM